MAILRDSLGIGGTFSLDGVEERSDLRAHFYGSLTKQQPLCLVGNHVTLLERRLRRGHFGLENGSRACSRGDDDQDA